MKRNYRFMGWFLMLAIVAGVYSFYYFSYIPSKNDSLNDRGFRILKEFGKNTSEQKEYYLSHLRNFGSHYAKRDEIEAIRDIDRIKGDSNVTSFLENINNNGIRKHIR
ncbi:MAG: hypothetical protein MI922_11205, partial [Bacteroidales bacterium]|nr:hypothetical protein [Bacteroidales bacterium]